MASQASGANYQEHKARQPIGSAILDRILKSASLSLQTISDLPDTVASKSDRAEVEATIEANVQKASPSNSDLLRDSEDGCVSRTSSGSSGVTRQQITPRSQAQGIRAVDTPSPSPIHLEIPQRFAGFAPFPSPSNSTRSGSPEHLPNEAPFFVQRESPILNSSPNFGSTSSLREYHYSAAHYHNESAAYHDSASEYFDSAVEYHDNAVEYHDSRARFHRVQFHSPIASFFPLSAQALAQVLHPRTIEESVAGSIHSSPDPTQEEATLSGTSTSEPSSMMSATDPQHASIPVAGDDNTSKAAATECSIKWILRAKTPSFSSDSEAEVYNGPSVSMNADKGWEPDVKKIKKKGKVGSSRGASSSSNTSTVKHVSGSVPGSGLKVPSLDAQGIHARTSSGMSSLQVPPFDAKDSHSRTSSGISGLSRITTASGLTGKTSNTGFLDQDELMTRMLNPEQQVRNAENHAKAMRDALAKAVKDREDAEDRAAVAEALLKSSHEFQANELGETDLVEKLRLAEEKLKVSQGLLEKSRQRNVEYQDRSSRAERLVQRMADRVKVGVPAIVNSANADVAAIQVRLDEAIKRAEKAEQRLKETLAGLQGGLTQSYKDALERAEIAEKRAQTAEELQEKDRLWTVDADERAVHAENLNSELRAEIVRSQGIVADHKILLMHARSRAEKAEQDVKDAECELEAFESRAIEFEKEAYEFKTKFHGLKRYTDKLQEHHNEREKEYMACNVEWKNREEEFIKHAEELKRWGDEGIAKANEAVKKLEDIAQDMAHDKQLIISTFSNAITQMQKSGNVMESKELERLVAWAHMEPSEKKGKESVATTREKARRTLEGLAFTPSLEAGTAQFEGSQMETAPRAPPPSVTARPSQSNNSEDEEALLAKQMATLQTEDGVLRFPDISRGRWYTLNKTLK